MSNSKRCKKWYGENKDVKKKYSENRRSEIKKWFNDYKKTLKCSRCSENDWRCLDFNHNKNTRKVNKVSAMVSIGCSKKKILEEIKKCTVLCANCHRKFHNGMKWKD